MSENFLTVSELNTFIRDVLKSGFPQAVWVCGEIQELREKGGHLYFTLSQKDEAGVSVIAKIGVSIWLNTRSRIEAVLAKAQNPFQLKEDIQVKLLCKVDFYPPFGQVRLIVENIDPIYTFGKIAQDRLRLINTLKQQGVLDRNKRLDVPLVPLGIGLITSHDSAAYHDFIDELRRSHFGFKVTIVDALMQGKNTDDSVVSGIKLLQQLPTVEVIVITRGGGSVADLSAFDSAKIAQAISDCPKPVLTGIGHEINTTVTDLAAHTFAKTPTATAQWLVGRVTEFLQAIDEKHVALLRGYDSLLKEKRNELKDTAQSLSNTTLNYLKEHQQRLVQIKSILSRQPSNNIKDAAKDLESNIDKLKKTIHLNLQRAQTKIQTYKRVVEMADPVNTLKRGFTITRDGQGKILKSIKDLEGIKAIETHFSDGKIASKIEA